VALFLEDDTDRVADFGAQNGTENTGVFPLGSAGLELGERRIGVFAVESLRYTVPMRCGLVR